jgi:hypothetical protein
MLATGSNGTFRTGLLMKIHVHGLGTLLAGAAAAMTAGCSPRTQAVIVEKWDGNRPMTLRLRSDSAAFAPGADGVDRVLLAWPLPGSEHGQPVYQLYLHVPTEKGTFAVGRTGDGQHVVAGMFIQRRGRYAGRTDLVKGRLRLDGPGGNGPTHRRGALIVDCGDGTRIAGRFDAVLSVTTVTQFEDHHRADIREMTDAAAALAPDDDASTDSANAEPLPASR